MNSSRNTGRPYVLSHGACVVLAAISFTAGCGSENAESAVDDTSATASALGVNTNTTFESPCTHRGAIYYLSPTGSDAALGTTQAGAWASITHAAQHLKPGDTLRMLGGVYYPTSVQTISQSGNSANWICFEAEAGQWPIWDGSRIEGATPDVIKFDLANYIVFSGGEVRNSKLHGIEVRRAHFVDVVGTAVHASAWAGISVGPDGANTTDATDIQIHGNNVYDNGLAGSAGPNAAPGTCKTCWPAILRSYGASRVSFTSNTVHENYGEGIDFILTNGGEMTDNVSYDNYSVNLYLDNVENATIARNFIYWTNKNRAAFVRKDTGRSPAGIQMSEEQEYAFSIQLKNNVIVDNVVVDCSDGIDYGTYGRNLGMVDSIIAGNTIYYSNAGAGGTPITIGIGGSAGHQGNQVFDNIFVGGDAYGPGNGSQFQYSHNLFYQGYHPTGMNGAGTIVADPKLAAAGALTAASYKVLAGSPAAKAGSASPALTSDFSGAARRTPPTIGAWESP